MIEAGSETTSSTLNSLLLYLSVAPDIVSRAQEELVAACGNERSPSFDDFDKLPYVRAMSKEILRLRPVASVGSPHYTDADVVYKDFFIPKGTVVTINQYAIQTDPRRYKDPEKFDPSRFLDFPLRARDYVGLADPNARDHWSFGGGRRICPGMHLAENSLFILTAKVLWAFTPRPPLDLNGNELPTDTSDNAYAPGTTTAPLPYRLRLVPRNDDVVATFQREWKQAQKEGYSLGGRKVNVDGIIFE